MKAFKHPELLEGEIFLYNIADKKIFTRIMFKTKRLGEVAYDGQGRKIELISESSELWPVFIQKSELEKGFK